MVVTLQPDARCVNRTLRQFTVAEYHQLGEAGVLDRGARCELIRGYIVEKTPMNPPHKKALRQLIDLLRPLVTTEYVFDSQAPITLTDSEPEPDISITVGPADQYDDRHAGPGEIALLVEVADSSLPDDRGEKLVMYAEARVPVYWIVNLRERIVEVYTNPRGGRTPGYRTSDTYAPGTAVPVVIGKKTVGTIPVTEILP